MDYSSITPEDNPHVDPWASSPQASRTSFEPRPSSDGEPNTPSPATPKSPYTDAASQPDEDQATESEPRISSDASVTGRGGPQLEHGQNGDSTQQSHQNSSQDQQRDQQQDAQHTSQAPKQPPRSAQRYHGQRPRSRQEPQKYKLNPRVTGLERPTRKDLIVRFDIQTNLPGYRTTQFRDLRRSHIEFGRLADHLISANPEALVPALPPSSTPAGVGTDEDETRTRASMQRWMSVVCSSDVLMRDDEMVRFIEGDPGYSPVMRRSQPATGVRRKVLKQFAPPPDDTPELQEARPVVKRFYLGAMECGQKVDRAVKARRGLGIAETDFGSKLTALTEQETHPGLKHAYRKLGRTIQATGDLHAAQGTAEATVLADPLHYHSSDAFIVKETLTNRHILLRDLLQAQQARLSKHRAADRLKASSSVRRDKVDEAIASLEEATTQENYLHAKTARVTANLLAEQRTWFARTAADMRASIRELVVREIEAERRILATLESVRPDVRAIDASGGLSRLGREATPAARRVHVQSSQGPKGDAWSGVARQQDGLNRSVSGSYVVAGKAAHNNNNNNNEGDDGGNEGKDGGTTSRKRAVSGVGSLGGGGGEANGQDDDQDRVDARNAASRLASSTF